MKKSIKYQILVPMICIVLVACTLILGVVVFIFSNYVDDEYSSSLLSNARILLNEYDNLSSEAQLCSRQVADSDEVKGAMINGGSEALLVAAQQATEDMSVSFCTITDADGMVLLRLHEPEKYGDDNSDVIDIASALNGESFLSAATGNLIPLAIRAGEPIYSEEGELLGAVSSGFRLDQKSFVDEMKQLLGSEVTVFKGDTRLMTTLENSDGTRAVGTQVSSEIYNTVAGGEQYIAKAKIDGRSVMGVYTPLATSGGEVLGMLYVGEYTDEQSGIVFNFIWQGLIVMAVILAVATPLIIKRTNKIVVPIREMAELSGCMAEGEVDVEVNVKSDDELGLLAASFEKMIAGSKMQADIISEIAMGNYNVDIQPRSDKDVVGLALVKMLDKNNNVFQKINETADIVSDASKNIAAGAQELAQGSVEQSATVDGLSDTVNSVSSQARENAQLAKKAFDFIKDIGNNAQSSSERMGRLTEAVNDINEASSAINNVIKAIDDIAFQTNILSLNAAVEAARAGNHGKGFAVVAEEVRTLSAKSAEAAKSSGGLIANSIKKAELGARIAAETEASLVEVVEGVGRSAKVIEDIAKGSAQQSTSLDEINEAIEQVSQVVQENTATSEESAAASQTMSDKAEALKGLTGLFKLRDSAGDVPEKTFAAAKNNATPQDVGKEKDGADKY